MSASEFSEQVALVKRLKACGIFFEHVPMGERRTKKAGRRVKKLGGQAGSPDLRIYDRPPLAPEAPGVALELKRCDGTEADVDADQWAFMAALEDRGWLCLVAYGCRCALRQLRALGYDV